MTTKLLAALEKWGVGGEKVLVFPEVPPMNANNYLLLFTPSLAVVTSNNIISLHVLSQTTTQLHCMLLNKTCR